MSQKPYTFPELGSLHVQTQIYTQRRSNVETPAEARFTIEALAAFLNSEFGHGASSLPTGTTGQTLRHDGTDWVVSSALQNDGTNITITGTLQVDTTTGTATAVMGRDAGGVLRSMTLGDGLSIDAGVLSATVDGLPSGTTTQTLRHDGTSWLASSALQNDGTNIRVTGTLQVDTTTGTATAVMGRDAGGVLRSVTLGAGLAITSGTLSATVAGLPSGTTGQTLRHNGTDWIASSVLVNNGTKLTLGGVLEGSSVLSAYIPNAPAAGAVTYAYVDNPTSGLGFSGAQNSRIYVGGNAILYIESQGIGVGQITSSQTRIRTQTSGDTSGHFHLKCKQNANNDNVFVIRADGRVGIGTSVNESPTEALDVGGNSRVRGTLKIDTYTSSPASSGLLGRADNDTVSSITLGSMVKLAANVLQYEAAFAELSFNGTKYLDQTTPTELPWATATATSNNGLTATAADNAISANFAGTVLVQFFASLEAQTAAYTGIITIELFKNAAYMDTFAQVKDFILDEIKNISFSKIITVAASDEITLKYTLSSAGTMNLKQPTLIVTRLK